MAGTRHQALRTQLGEHTATALFILEALAPMTDEQVTDAAERPDEPSAAAWDADMRGRASLARGHSR